MNIALWIVQALLAIIFLMTGGMKLTQPKATLLEKGMHALEPLSPNIIRLIGLAEILGTIGIVLPLLIGILPWLTPLAAVGLALVMLGATVTHLQRGEISGSIVTVMLLLATFFVAYGRYFL